MSLNKRSSELELMDDLSLDNENLYSTLHTIERLNRLLGGHRIVRMGILESLKSLETKMDGTIRIAEVGCGLGDNLKAIKNLQKDVQFDLIGYDANPNIVSYASQYYNKENIRFERFTLSESNAHQIDADVIIFSLFLHHFNDEAIIGMLKRIDFTKVKRIIISDLERSAISLNLYRILARVFNLNSMAKYDGVISIKRGFKRSDLESFFLRSNLEVVHLKRHFAFRYLAILKNDHE